MSKLQFFKYYDKYLIGIETADGRKRCIRGWYQDCRINHNSAPKGYHVYEFREDDNGEDYLAFIEPFVMVNRSGSFVTKAEIPFGIDGNPMYFKVQYGRSY